MNIGTNIIKLSAEEPLCFVHVPKTGGTSVVSFLNNTLSDVKIGDKYLDSSNGAKDYSVKDGCFILLGHFNAKDLEHKNFQPQLITVFRNPVERIVSLYYFWRSHSYEHIDNTWGALTTARFCKKHSLKEFVFSKYVDVERVMFNAQSRQVVHGITDIWRETDQELLLKSFKKLSKYKLVGTTDRLNHFIKELNGLLNLPKLNQYYWENSNASLEQYYPETHSPKPQEISRAVTTQILRMNLVDQIVYEGIHQFCPEGETPISLVSDQCTKWAVNRLKELKQFLNVSYPKSSRFYYGKNKTDVYSRWLGELRFQGPGFVMRGSPRKLYLSGKLLEGVVISDFDKKDPSSDCSSILENCPGAVGVFRQAAAPKALTSFIELGYLVECSKIRKLQWFPRMIKKTDTLMVEFTENSNFHIVKFEKLLLQFNEELSGWSYGSRSLEYLKHRYLNHPVNSYGIKWIVDSETKIPLCLVVFKRISGGILIMDYIGAFNILNRSIYALGYYLKGDITVTMYMPENVIENHEIVSKMNISTDFITVYYDGNKNKRSEAKRLYITAGDTNLG